MKKILKLILLPLLVVVILFGIGISVYFGVKDVKSESNSETIFQEEDSQNEGLNKFYQLIQAEVENLVDNFGAIIQCEIEDIK